MRIAATTMLICSIALASAVRNEDFLRLIQARTADNPRPLPVGQAPPKPGRRLGARPGTDSVIQDDFACNDDTTGGNPQQGAAIAVDGRGCFVVSWYEFRDGDADAWFQRFDSVGTRLGENERLNTDVTMGWQGDPASAMAPDGGFAFSWEDRRDIGNSDVFSQRFDPAGDRLGDNFRVSDSAADGDQDISGLHIAQDGTALVAWDDRRLGITGDIFAQFYDSSGARLDTNFRVNDDPVGLANQYEPSVGGDDSGRFVVVWMDGRGHNAYDWNIFMQRFDAERRRLGANVQVTTDDSIQWSPGVGAGRSGRFVVSWDDRRRAQYDVYAQLYDAQGNPVGSNFRVNDDAGSTDQYGSSAAMNFADEFIIAWTDKRNGDEDVYARRFAPDGTPLGPGFRVNDASTANQAIPSVGARPDGGYWVAWADARSGDLDIYAQRLDRTGNPVGGNFRVNDDHASSLQRVSSIGMDARGYICTAWEDERNGSTDIYRCLTDPEGRAVGSNLRLNDDGPGGAPQYYTAVAGGNNRFLAAWNDDRDDWNIYAQFMDGNGQPVNANFLVNSDATGAFQWYPYCAMDSGNNAAIIWMDTRLGGDQTFLRRYDPAGNPLAPESPVSDDTTAEAVYASVAMSRAGWCVVAWMDNRLGQYNAYCQLFRPDGSRVGNNIRCNTDTSSNYHGYPACAVTDQGEFVVAWEDTRNTYYNVYLQWFDSTGARLGGNVKVNEGAWNTDAYSPSCAFAPDGRLAVEFNDERDLPGCPQIYCQRFAADRTRWGLNRMVNDPNLYPKNHHWTVAQSVAAGDQALAFAWTDNRRHQGWDIFAKVTDWEVVGMAGADLSGPGRAVVQPTVTHGPVRVAAAGLTPGEWCVSVFDVSGRLVVNQKTERGTAELNLNHLASGAYFVVLRQGKVAEQHKVILE